jgi:hypothetical protein
MPLEDVAAAGPPRNKIPRGPGERLHASGPCGAPCLPFRANRRGTGARLLLLLRPRGTPRDAQRAPAFVFESAPEARAFGEWMAEHFGEIKRAAETTPHRAPAWDRAVLRPAGSCSRGLTTRPATRQARTSRARPPPRSALGSPRTTRGSSTSTWSRTLATDKKWERLAQRELIQPNPLSLHA